MANMLSSSERRVSPLRWIQTSLGRLTKRSEDKKGSWKRGIAEEKPISSGFYSEQAVFPLLETSTELQVQVLSFLSEQDTRSMMQANRHFCQLLKNPEGGGAYIWKSLACQRWSFVEEDVIEKDFTMRHDASRLLSLAAATTPSQVDVNLFTSEVDIVHKDGIGTNASTTVQYTGSQFGKSRSIRANAPLPRPMGSRRETSSFLGRCTRNKRSKEQRRPFEVPFRLTNGRFCWTPRWIAYFEVNVLESSQDEKSQARLSSTLFDATPTECVAVGLSTAGFDLAQRLPGWDGKSIGYHSDDGMAYPAPSSSSRWPCFGVGDVVGCGIDHQAKTVFYTLNGKFLGHFFHLTDKELEQAWFPTVGLDTRAAIECNFGTNQPFAYDLATMLAEKNHGVIRE